ncbi:translocation and assembly module lipoprotein TamL [Aestuariibaculum sediminum]|uniref:BamA/TamA family outer membrane protein n=1 Tax=Aestuariibaculum sediminum TaxID=2770637 RepID=A0A8J6PZP5_9FLAO|nr:BamA/TamA family outer membrane protein [Aestuariibaculum sediminum]MBD0832448.1 BamA/TamA family outer membrane protein [Aestuariibaculum sediminum]
MAGILFSCNAVKRVDEKDYLLTNNAVLINGKKNKSETIGNLLYQKPNSKIPVVNTPLRLHIYNLARPNIDSILEEKIYNNPKKLKRKTKKFSRKQVNKDVENRLNFNAWLKSTGEAPVIVSEDKSEKSVKRLEDYHINNGWFDVEASYEINKKDNKRADVEYNVETGPAFLLDTITTKIKSPVIDSIYHKKILRNSLIKSKEQYRTSNFEQERDRISNELRNSGLFHFNQDYIGFEIDTIGTNKKVNVDIQIQNRTIRDLDSIYRVPFNIYKVKDVNIITDYTFEKRNKKLNGPVNYKGYKLWSYGKMRYRPKAITDAVFITPGEIFKDNDRTLTYRHINGLRTFKYPNIDQVEIDNHTLSDTIRLTALKKFSLGFSTDVSTSNIQTVGFSLNPSLLMRNIFRGAETLEISAIGSIGSSRDQNEGDPFFDINEIGADLKLTIPRFFFPFNTNNLIAKDMSPSTRISLATTSQTNIGLDKQTLSGVFNYKWSPSQKVTDRLDAFNIQYVRNLNIDNYFNVYTSSFDNLENIALNSYNTPSEFISIDNNGQESLIIDKSDEFIDLVLSDDNYQSSNPNQYKEVNNINERKQRLTENNLILASSFSLTNDERTNLFDEDFSIFRFKLETAGNILSGMSDILGLQKNTNGRYELFNVAYSQYIKTELDYVKHWDLGKKNILAFRSFFGIAIPYGNSTNIPFSKSFFAGGANDNRAWNAYSLGPGSSKNSNDFNEANLKIALSAEHRFNIFEDLNGAVFVDAGNIWNVLDDVEDENAVFSNFNSLEDIAIGTGFGLRYDFSFFVFRFDIGFKTYDPSYQDNNRWFNDYNFGNAVYNIGINYPF